ncbi:MAG: beta-lactamase family protein, partial [Sphingomonadaceae bacterium]|nr:beta-lactamase family protein [Sphingomonadaceae bacterium]
TLAGLHSICPPGQCHAYQNVAYDAASDIVEKVTGKPYARAVHEQLFLPLGMTSATMSRRGLMSARSWARPHRGGRGSKPLEVMESYYRVPAAGGVNSSILDLAVWMQAQMGMAPEVLSPSVLAALHRPQVRTIGEDRRNRRYLGRLTNAHYALGWRVYDYAGHRLVGHRGAVSGYRSMILFDPESRTGVVAMWNSSSGRPFGVAIDAFDMLYGLPDGDWTRGGEGAREAMPDPAIASEIPVSTTGRRRPGATFETPSTR